MLQPRVSSIAFPWIQGTGVFPVACLDFHTTSLPLGSPAVGSFVAFVYILFFFLMLQACLLVSISDERRKSFGLDRAAHAGNL